MHALIPEQGRWLRSVVVGFVRYDGVPSNSAAISHFRFQIGRYSHFTLRRRSERKRLNWKRMYRLMTQWLPPADICYPYPLRRIDVIT
ncbi:MAG: RNA-directed DNA polymerase [Acidobacteriota bacterium]